VLSQVYTGDLTIKKGQNDEKQPYIYKLRNPFHKIWIIEQPQTISK
jgi:hypothetical protein